MCGYNNILNVGEFYLFSSQNNGNFGWCVHLAMQSIVSLVFSFKDDLHLMNNWRVGPVNNTQRIHIIAYPNVLVPVW